MYFFLHPARPEAPLTRTKWICQLATVHICHLPKQKSKNLLGKTGRIFYQHIRISYTTKCGLHIRKVESGVLSLNFQLDRERPCFCSNTKPTAQPSQRAPTPPPNASKSHRPAIYANFYGAQDAGFSADWCACISVCRELRKCILGA